MGYQVKEKIDQSIGNDTFDLWTELQRRLRLEKKRYETIVKKNFGVYDDGLSFRIDLADQLQADLETVFQFIVQNRKADKQEVVTIMVLFELAIDTIERENDLFEGIFGSQLVAMMTPLVRLFPKRELAAELAYYKKVAASLEAALKRAKGERIEAYIDKAIDIAGLAIEFIPSLSLASKVVIGIASLAADSELGPQKPDASKITRTTISTFSDELEKVKTFNGAMKTVSKYGGKLNAAYDVLNTDEIDQANKNVQDVKNALKEQKKIHEKVIKQIWAKWEVRVMNFQIQLEKIEMNLKDSKYEMEELRRVLREEVQKANYRPGKAWRILP
jgi:hypothetical protein